MEKFLITIAVMATVILSIQGETIMIQEILKILSNYLGMEMAAGVEFSLLHTQLYDGF